jgi:hypothetical protein
MQSVSSSSAANQTAAPHGAHALGFVALGVALLTVSYWVIWYAGGRDLLASSHTPEYFAFENASPPPMAGSRSARLSQAYNCCVADPARSTGSS